MYNRSKAKPMLHASVAGLQAPTWVITLGWLGDSNIVAAKKIHFVGREIRHRSLTSAALLSRCCTSFGLKGSGLGLRLNAYGLPDHRHKER